MTKRTLAEAIKLLQFNADFQRDYGSDSFFMRREDADLILAALHSTPRSVSHSAEVTEADLALAKSLMNAGRAASYEAGAQDIARHRAAEPTGVEVGKWRAITMQDVRLRVGEGRLSAADVLVGCNAELAARAALGDQP